MWVESLILLNQYTDESQPSGAQWLFCDLTPLNKSFLNGLMIQDWINLLNTNRRSLNRKKYILVFVWNQARRDHTENTKLTTFIEKIHALLPSTLY
jgi:hypothetical protein